MTPKTHYIIHALSLAIICVLLYLVVERPAPPDPNDRLLEALKTSISKRMADNDSITEVNNKLALRIDSLKSRKSEIKIKYITRYETIRNIEDSALADSVTAVLARFQPVP